MKIILIMTLLVPVLANATMYRCDLPNGDVVFQDSICESVDSKVVEGHSYKLPTVKETLKEMTAVARKKCFSRWGDDYVVVNHCINVELKAMFSIMGLM